MHEIQVEYFRINNAHHRATSRNHTANSRAWLNGQCSATAAEVAGHSTRTVAATNPPIRSPAAAAGWTPSSLARQRRA
jgi:hypothetical protein